MCYTKIKVMRRKFPNILQISIVAFVLTFSAAGCATTGYNVSSDSVSEKSLTVSNVLRFDDIPVPAGFVVISNESFIFQTENLRAGVLRYAGKASPDLTMQFYKEQMPAYNWQSINTIEFGKKQLTFEKTGQNCVVTIEGTRSKSVITISVGPKSEKTKVIR
ncbi:MAG: hypothetical protein V1933_06760 [Candidatus Omnitrophota bacterium]